MKHLKNWTICLNGTEQDEAILEVISNLTQSLVPERISIVHIIEHLDIPSALLKDYPDLHEPQKEQLQTVLKEKSQLFLKHLSNVNIEVLEGNKITTLLNYIMDSESDLVVLGKGSNRGRLITKLSRKSSASVMIVPQSYHPKMRHIAVSTDFSDHSTRALQIAESLKSALNVPELSAVHVYRDASRYVGESIESPYDVDKVLVKRSKVEDKLKTYAIHKLEQHVDEACSETSAEQVVLPTQIGRKKSESFVRWVQENRVDFVVMGAKGQSAAEAILLGSFAEDVYENLENQLVLLFKQKNENKNFLKVLLRR